jgi:hypothetical protein
VRGNSNLLVTLSQAKTWIMVSHLPSFVRRDKREILSLSWRRPSSFPPSPFVKEPVLSEAEGGNKRGILSPILLLLFTLKYFVLSFQRRLESRAGRKGGANILFPFFPCSCILLSVDCS